VYDSRQDACSFSPVVRTNAGDGAVSGFDRLLCWSRSTFEWVYWGTGKNTPTFLAGLDRWPDNRFLNLFAVWPTGQVYIELRFIRNPPFAVSHRRERLREALVGIPGIHLSSATWRPSFEVAALMDDQAWQQFTGVMENTLDELRNARGT
jgi:hypothetical protein